jgi:hypothetical protein
VEEVVENVLCLLSVVEAVEAGVVDVRFSLLILNSLMNWKPSRLVLVVRAVRRKQPTLLTATWVLSATQQLLELSFVFVLVAVLVAVLGPRASVLAVWVDLVCLRAVRVPEEELVGLLE